MVGACLTSITVAGPELKILFSGGGIKGISYTTIDTDALVLVENENIKANYSEYNEDDFFPSRRKVIVELYKLTGYDVQSVEIKDNGLIEIGINNQFIIIYPFEDVTKPGYIGTDSWNLITENFQGDAESLISFDCNKIHVNPKNSLTKQ